MVGGSIPLGSTIINQFSVHGFAMRENTKLSSKNPDFLNILDVHKFNKTTIFAK